MANVFVQDHEMTAIANTLREVNNTDEKYLLSEIPDAIEEGVIKYANKKTAVGSSVTITDAADMRLIELNVYGCEEKINNLLPYPGAYDFLIDYNLGGSKHAQYCGLDVTVNDDGSITVDGTATSTANFFLYILSYNLIDWSNNPDGQSWTLVFDIGLSDESARDNVTNFYSKYTTELKTPIHLTFDEVMNIGGGMDSDEFSFDLKAGATFNNLTIYPQVNLDYLKPWSPCGMPSRVENQIKITMSNDSEHKEVALPIEGTLYYCESKEHNDHIDFERKKLVKHYNREHSVSSCDMTDNGNRLIISSDVLYDADGGVLHYGLCQDKSYIRTTNIDELYQNMDFKKMYCFFENKLYICNPEWADYEMSGGNFDTWLRENPIPFIYPTTEPIEYDLTDEQIEAFKQMKTYRGNTTISTDCDAIMEITYVVNPESGVV